jgi:hypothetical protein
LAQFYMIALVKKVKLDPLFLDCGMQIHRHADILKPDIPFPDRSVH